MYVTCSNIIFFGYISYVFYRGGWNNNQDDIIYVKVFWKLFIKIKWFLKNNWVYQKRINK